LKDKLIDQAKFNDLVKTEGVEDTVDKIFQEFVDETIQEQIKAPKLVREDTPIPPI
jgi:hypothetical protein